MEGMNVWILFGMELGTIIAVVTAIIISNRSKSNYHDEKIDNLTKSIDRLTGKIEKIVEIQIKHEIDLNRLKDQNGGKTTQESFR